MHIKNTHTFLILLSIFAISCKTLPKVDYLIKEIGIVDLKSGRVLQEQNVIIHKGLISYIGPEDPAYLVENYIDGKGKFLVPSFWDMHSHFRSQSTEDWLPLFIVNGVTHVRDMGLSLPKKVIEIKNKIDKGEIVGPKIFSSLVMLEGEHPRFSNSISVTNVNQVPELIDSLILEGADFIKVSHNIKPKVYREILLFAQKNNILTAGHIPEGMSTTEASNLGLKSIEHSWGFDELKSEQEKNELQETLIKNQSYVCPTFTGAKRYWPLIDDEASSSTLQSFLEKDPHLIYAPAHFRTWWKSILTNTINDSQFQENLASMTESFRKRKQILAQFSNGGVKFLVGTDTPNPYAIPGFSVHEEMIRLHKSGLSELEILRAASWYPSLFFNLGHSIGLVEQGFQANLIILRDNPLEDINAVNSISGVFKGETYYPQSILNRLKKDVGTSLSQYHEKDFDQQVYMHLRNQSVEKVKSKFPLHKNNENPRNILRLAAHFYSIAKTYNDEKSLEKACSLTLWGLEKFPKDSSLLDFKRDTDCQQS